MHASIAGPIWPAVSSDDMYQRLRRPNALRTSTTVAPENPGSGTPGPGYRMVGSDGGIFSFAAPFYGSLGAHPPASPIIAMSPSVDGGGYYMLGADGTVYNFGDAPNLGSVTVALPAPSAAPLLHSSASALPAIVL